MRLYKRIAFLGAVLSAATITSASAQNWLLAGNTTGNFFGTTNSSSITILTNNTNRGIIDASGNVGIGTTTPGRLFHVNFSGSPQVRFSDPTANVAWDLWSGSNFLISRVNNGVTTDWIKFDDVGHAVRIGPSSQFYIDIPNNRIGIGTTSPDDKLEVNGSITPSSDCGGDVGGDLGKWNTIYAANGTIQTSDIRKKEDIENIHYGLATVLKLHPVTYTWKELPHEGRKVGFIAQELQPVIPEVVVTGEHSLGVMQTDLIPVVARAIQEQQAISVENAKRQHTMRTTAEDLNARLTRLEAAANARGLSGVESPELGSNGVRLDQNDPNPTDGLTTISYTIPSSVAKAELVISEISTGREISRNAISNRGAGQTTISMADFNSGTYVYTIIADGKVAASRKMVVAK